VAVSNGVVYFHTSGQSSKLYALDARTGQLLTKEQGLPAGLPTQPATGAISGPSVSNGQIYFGTGTFFASGQPTSKTGIVAFGL